MNNGVGVFPCDKGHTPPFPALSEWFSGRNRRCTVALKRTGRSTVGNRSNIDCFENEHESTGPGTSRGACPLLVGRLLTCERATQPRQGPASFYGLDGSEAETGWHHLFWGGAIITRPAPLAAGADSSLPPGPMGQHRRLLGPTLLDGFIDPCIQTRGLEQNTGLMRAGGARPPWAEAWEALSCSSHMQKPRAMHPSPLLAMSTSNSVPSLLLTPNSSFPLLAITSVACREGFPPHLHSPTLLRRTNSDLDPITTPPNPKP